MRSLLYKEDTSMTAVVDAGIIPALITAIDNDDCPNLQYQALGVLTSIALTLEDHTMAAVNSGVIPKLLSFLSFDDELSERSLLALGSFALHSGAARAALLSAGVVGALLPYLTLETSPHTCLSHLRAFNNFCSQDDEDTLLNFDLVSPALPSMAELLLSKEQEILVEVCTALMNMMYDPGSIEAVQAVPSLTERLVPLLGHGDSDVSEAAVGAVGNMLSGTEEQVDRCLTAGCLRPLIDLLQTSDHAAVGEAARAVGNILGGNHAQIQLALDSSMLTFLKKIIANGNLECQMEALRAVTQFCTKGSAEQHHSITTGGVLKLLCATLTHHDSHLAVQALKALLMLLKTASLNSTRELASLCCALDYFDVIRQLKMLITNSGGGADDLQYSMSLIDSLAFLAVALQNADLSNVEFYRMFRAATMVITTVRYYTREVQYLSPDEKWLNVKEVVRDLWSEDTETKSMACRAVGFFASGNQGRPALNALLDSGILPWAVATIDNGNIEDVLYATCVLLAITVGTQQHKMAVIRSGAVSRLVRLLCKEDDKLREIAAGCLGNLLRDVEEKSAEVITYFQDDTALEGLKMFVESYRTLSSQVVGSSLGEHGARLMIMLPLMSKLLDMADIKILEDVCWGFANLTAMKQAAGIIESVQTEWKVTPRLMQLLVHEDMRVRLPALVAACNMLHGTNNQTERLFESGFLDHLPSLLRSDSATLAMHAAEAIACIFRRTHHHIELVLEKDVLTPLTELLGVEDEGCMLKAAFAITCLCVNGSASQRARVSSRRVLEPFCATLTRPGCAAALDVSEGLWRLSNDATNDGKTKEFCLMLQELSVLDNLQQLQQLDGISEVLRYKANKLCVIIRQNAKEEILVMVDGDIVTLAEIIQDLRSSDEDTKTKGARAARNMLFNSDQSISALVEAGAVKSLVEALDSDCTPLQRHAAICLLRITTGIKKHLKVVIDSGAIPKLIAMLYRGTGALKEVCHTLATIADRDMEARDVVISCGALQAFLPYLRPDAAKEPLKHLLRCCREICSLQTDFRRISILLSCVPDLLQVEDEEVLGKTCELIQTMMDGPGERFGPVLALPGVSARLVELLNHQSVGVSYPVLGVIGNMLLGTDDQKQHLLELYVLTPILKILDNPHDYSFKFEATCALTNFSTTKKREHIVALAKSGAIPRLISLLSHEDLVVIQAVYTLANIAIHGPVMRDLVLSHGTVPSMRPHMRLGKPIELLRACTLAYSYLCKHDTIAAVDFEQIAPGIPYLFRLLEVDDINVLQNACRAFANLLKSNHIEALQEVPELTERVVRLMSHKAVPVKLAALQVVSTFTLGNPEQVGRCLNADCLKHMCQLLQCGEPELLLETVRTIGQIFTKIHGTVDMDWFKPLIEIIKREKCNSKLHVSALSTIVNFSVGPKERSIAIINSGIIPSLVEIISQRGESLMPAAKIIGNISQHVTEAREAIEREGVVTALVPYLKTDIPLEILRLHVQCFQAMIRHSMVTLELVDPMLPYLAELLHVSDSFVLTNTCTLILNLISSKRDDVREAVLTTPGVTSRLLALLGHDEIGVQKWTLCIYVNILSRNDSQTNRIFNDNLDEILDRIVDFLQSSNGYLVSTAAKATTNLFVKSNDWIECALDKGILEALLYVMEYGEIQSRQPAVLAYVNLCQKCTQEQRARVIASGVLEQICSTMARGDHTFAWWHLDIVNRLLQGTLDDGGDTTELCWKMEEIGLLEQLLRLRRFEIPGIQEKTVRLIRTYFPEELEDQGENEE